MRRSETQWGTRTTGIRILRGDRLLNEGRRGPGARCRNRPPSPRRRDAARVPGPVADVESSFEVLRTEHLPEPAGAIGVEVAVVDCPFRIGSPLHGFSVAQVLFVESDAVQGDAQTLETGDVSPAASPTPAGESSRPKTLIPGSRAFFQSALRGGSAAGEGRKPVWVSFFRKSCTLPRSCGGKRLTRLRCRRHK